MKTGRLRVIENPSQRATRREAAASRRLIDLMPLPTRAKEGLHKELDRHSERENDELWRRFAMLEMRQIDAIWDAVDQLPSKHRPREVRRVLDKILTNINRNTGIIDISRKEIAERTGIALRNISTAITVLATMGVVIREDKTTLRINPHAAWNGNLADALRAAKETPPPLLQLMQGGKP